MKIDSLKNPKIKELLKLYKPRYRREKKRILVEGEKEFSMALNSDFNLISCFFCPELMKKELLKKIPADSIEINQQIFSKVVYRENSSGLLAIFEEKKEKLENFKIKKNCLILILEAVEKPGNLGALLRTAEAVGVDLVIINEEKTDIYNPNVVRASLGAIFKVPVIISNQEETQVWLKENKIFSLALTPEAKKRYSDFDLKQSLAVLLGAEDQGLSNFWLEKADSKALIPMQGQIDSLNVSVSGAIVLYEALRQRLV